MIVVSDTSSICYLILIGEVDLFQLLFGQVFIPPSVGNELASPGVPAEVRAWIKERLRGLRSGRLSRVSD